MTRSSARHSVPPLCQTLEALDPKSYQLRVVYWLLCSPLTEDTAPIRYQLRLGPHTLQAKGTGTRGSQVSCQQRAVLDRTTRSRGVR
eukprot:7266155-Prymnesium_polylepis.1